MNLDRQSVPIGSKPALVVVDIINGFTDPACPLGGCYDAEVAANLELLTVFREQGLPVFFTTVVYQNEQQASVFRARIKALDCLQPDSNWIAIDDRLQRRADEPIIEKQWASSFFATSLAEQLEQQSVNSVVVAGLTTSGCVRATVVDALQHNYPTFVPKEAVGDRNDAAHEANLFDMHAKYADVISLAELTQLIKRRGA